MTKKEFQALTQSVVLLDGATGSNLMAAGMPKGVCTEAWVMEHKEIIQALQRAYVKAGSRILYAPTFCANRIGLSQHHLEGEIETFNRTLVSYTREVAGTLAYVAGDLTTTGKMMPPAGDLTYEQAFETYREQISLLADAGVDLLVAETMIHTEEALACVDAAVSVCDLPILCTMTVEADGSIFSGGNIFEAAAMLEEAGACAVGVNCSVGPDQLEAVIRNLKQTVSIPVIAKPNAGMPTISPQGLAIYDMDAPTFAEHLCRLAEAGATLIGGCCGTTPDYIREVHQRL